MEGDFLMLKSLCIKTNNENINNYLLENLQKLNLDGIYLSYSSFKLYENIIVHYKGNDVNYFLEEISNVLSDSIIEFYETKIIKYTIASNYFYFSELEQIKILSLCKDYIQNDTLEHSSMKKEIVSLSLQNYFIEHKSLILDGFVKFRINNYIKVLDSIVDLSVNRFVIDKEYSEFIDLLKIYINSKDYGSDIVHLIYNNQESVLLDKFKNIIELNSDILSKQYLSDISFSSNDFALNSLLTLLPRVIYIHLIDREDEFINTLKLIFDNRVFICNDCNICKLYRLEKINR